MALVVWFKGGFPRASGGLVKKNSGSGLRKMKTAIRTDRSASRTLFPKKFKFEETMACQDECDGILFYRSRDGEVICEGYDEGPQFRPAPCHQQEEEYRKDVKLYSIIPGIRLYLVEGTDYTCVDESFMKPFFEGKHENRHHDH
ncbi:hypothetical protein SUGI_0135390 [Cryptomeria japonica]|uniref:uncharacterized protein LOC131035031 n=1 Tax=Cryptomeria japonica TaxID=3369 RepID=UPI002408EAC1|nr:uncharacterized protein LOC131035031 [Cryptomeria japonica]GLJ10799.1 hypothetical protein SUGI_0135390 [Cryptomeria japonica]